MARAVVVEDLVVRYGDLVAVDGIDFCVEVGEIFALLGPNGAGKTSTLEVLEGYRRRNGGQVQVLGHDPQHHDRALRERIGVVLQSCGIDRALTVRELVRLFADMYGRRNDADTIIDLVDLTDKAGARAGQLSGGQLRRLDLALAVVGDPDLLFLDEPTTGFDPQARHSAWELIEQLRDRGTTVLLTSHYLDEVQRLADRVAVMRDGRIISESTPTALGGRDEGTATIRLRRPFAEWTDLLPAGPWEVVPGGPDEVLLRTANPTDALFVLTGWASGRGEELPSLTVERQSLEDAYLRLTAHVEDESHATPAA